MGAARLSYADEASSIEAAPGTPEAGPGKMQGKMRGMMRGGMMRGMMPGDAMDDLGDELCDGLRPASQVLARYGSSETIGSHARGRVRRSGMTASLPGLTQRRGAG